MNEAEVIEIVRDGILTLVAVSAPALMVGLVVGLLISVLQALTSIQEMTLTFVPKIIALFLSIIFFTPYMLHKMQDFSARVFDRIVGIG